MAAALSLATLDFRMAKDNRGTPIVPKFEFTPGTLTYAQLSYTVHSQSLTGLFVWFLLGKPDRRPMPFESECVPRSEKAESLIPGFREEHPWGSTDPQTLAALQWRCTT